MAVADRRHIVLLSCVKSKQQTPALAADLYTSTWFRSALAYAHSLQPDLVLILSAKHGVVDLDERIEPYEQTLNRMDIAERRRWAAEVLAQLGRRADLERDEFTILAGKKYREFVVPGLRRCRVPMEGLRQGEQLQYLRRHARDCENTRPDLRSEFIRVDRQPSQTLVLVRTITWQGPHTPETRWVPVSDLLPDAPEQEIEAAIIAVLGDPRFFHVCLCCGEKTPVGWMHSGTVCQSCAERHLGVVY